eukprot:4422394-Heterocapsa_arctica.AAC.1
MLPRFEAPSCLVRGNKRMPLIVAGPLYYLPVHVSEPIGESKLRMVDVVNNIDAMPENINDMEPNNIKLFEYCCADNSLMSSWFLAHRQEA